MTALSACGKVSQDFNFPCMVLALPSLSLPVNFMQLKEETLSRNQSTTENCRIVVLKLQKCFKAGFAAEAGGRKGF